MRKTPTGGERPRERGAKSPRHTEWRGGTLHGRWRYKNILRRWSLKTDDPALAARRVEDDIKRKKEALDRAERGERDGRLLWGDVAAAWGEQREHALRATSRKRYGDSIVILERFGFGDLFIDEISDAVVEKFILARRVARKAVSTATIRRDLDVLAQTLVFAGLPDNPATRARKRLRERRDPIVLPRHQDIETVIAAAPGMLADLMRAAWRTGCRIDELVTAERARLDHVRRQLTVVGKGNKLRVIDLDYAGAYELIRALPVRLGCKWLFWHGDGLPYREASDRFSTLIKSCHARALAQAQANGHAEPDFRKFRFHDLRHLHAVEWLKDGRSLYDLQQRLGHSSLVTTEKIYCTYLTPQEQRRVKFGQSELVTEKTSATATKKGDRAS